MITQNSLAQRRQFVRENVAAFKLRLREVGYYRDLSDADDCATVWDWVNSIVGVFVMEVLNGPSDRQS